jgi:hypothetical protein
VYKIVLLNVVEGEIDTVELVVVERVLRVRDTLPLTLALDVWLREELFVNRKLGDSVLLSDSKKESDDVRVDVLLRVREPLESVMDAVRLCVPSGVRLVESVLLHDALTETLTVAEAFDEAELESVAVVDVLPERDGLELFDRESVGSTERLTDSEDVPDTVGLTTSLNVGEGVVVVVGETDDVSDS